MPMPHDGEMKEKFMERCMSAKAMMDEFPDEKQRSAVCMKQFKGEHKNAAPQIERRSIPMELRVMNDAPRRIAGHAAVFNTPTDIGGFTESIQPGAFRDTIAGDDIAALFNHNPSYVLGRTRNKTLRLAEDATGLYMEVDLPDTTQARDLMELIKRGDVSQQSFTFMRPGKDDEEWKRLDGHTFRTLKKLRIMDVSPVTFPAYPTTSVSVRTADEVFAEHEADAGATRVDPPAPEETEPPVDRQAIVNSRIVEMQSTILERGVSHGG